MNDQHDGLTRRLTDHLAQLSFEALPGDVVEQAKLVLIGGVGNIIGGCGLRHQDRQTALVKNVGGGVDQATLIGTGTRVSLPLAGYGNGLLSNLLDYGDGVGSESGRLAVWPGAMAVPAALGAVELMDGTGAELVTSVLAGYECAARVQKSMDASAQRVSEVIGSTASTLAAAASAAKGLRLDADQTLSAIGMAGIYTPVSAGYKWMGDDGLHPRKDIKQGWAWMCMTGVFGAVSARHGLQMLQQNHLFEGEHGYWRALGYDIFRPERITEGLGELFHVRDYHCKPYPGGSVTHSAVAGALELVRAHGIPVEIIESITVGTNAADATGLDTPHPVRFIDRPFSMQYQVASALTQGAPGPNWYAEELVDHPLHARLMRTMRVVEDAECEAMFRETAVRMARIEIITEDGDRYETRIPATPRLRTAAEIAGKFIETVTQVAGAERAEQLLAMLEDVENLTSVRELIREIDLVARNLTSEEELTR